MKHIICIKEISACIQSMKDLEAYYSKRAQEHDQVYQKPERQHDLNTLKTMISPHFLGLEVLDIGCGPGYWTQEVSKVAKSIVGVDINNSVLELAAEKIMLALYILIREVIMN